MNLAAINALIASDPDSAADLLLWESAGLYVSMYLLAMCQTRGAP